MVEHVYIYIIYYDGRARNPHTLTLFGTASVMVRVAVSYLAIRHAIISNVCRGTDREVTLH